MSMHQPVVYTPTPAEVDIDGHVDARGIRYLGTAVRQPNGKYLALAIVDLGISDGSLCRVEVTLSFPETDP